ncbi:MAG: EAL domain-containing protein [Acidimicrobiales bacterium]
MIDGTGPVTVLVVDDDDAVRRLLVRALGRRGFELIEATDGTAALDAIRSREIDVVLLDAGLPDISGLDVLSQVRADPRTVTLPVILVTGNAELDQRVAGLEAGADDYLTKPVDLDELTARVNAQIRGRDAWRSQVEQRLHDRARAAGALAAIPRGGSGSDVAREIARVLVRLPLVTSASIITLARDGSSRYLAAVDRDGVELVESGAHLDGALAGELRQALGPGADVLSSRRGGHLVGTDLGATVVAGIAGDARFEAVAVLGTSVEDIDRGSDALRELLSAVIDLAVVSEHLLVPALHSQDGRDAVVQRIRAVIDDRAFHPVFQPIVELSSGTVTGYEALSRFSDGVPPDRHFADAERVGLGVELELATMNEALRVARRLPAGRYLSVNASASLLATGDLAPLLTVGGDRRLILELTEHERVDDYEAIQAAFARLGGDIEMSVDDAGSGWASLRHVLTLRPHFVKLDRAWVASVDEDPARQALLLGIGRFVEQLGGTVVAEGIETESERASLESLGIRFGQGYHLGRPVPIGQVVDG